MQPMKYKVSKQLSVTATEQDDVNGTLVKMQSPGDNSAELKGQSCHRSKQSGTVWWELLELTRKRLHTHAQRQLHR